jgi:bifunctional UDP-N-acetylglucosamine pyrophosphorylase/glucosamine-1-phosphate N-acetyltransferase
MKTAVLLAAGQGTKMWPYAVVRPKAMIPVCNRPVVAWSVEALLAAGIERVLIAAGPMAGQIRHFFRDNERVSVIDAGCTSGTADTLQRMEEYVGRDPFLVLYGDTILEPETLRSFLDDFEQSAPAVLAAPIDERECGGEICLNVQNGRVAGVCAHPRGGYRHKFAAFIFTFDVFRALRCNSGRFDEVQVGMMSPLESYLEMTVFDLMQDGPVAAQVCREGRFMDLDKPWHVLEANAAMGERLCGALTGNEFAPGAQVDPSARLEGFVRLGRNSRIGANVIIRGNCVIGEETVVDSGAILQGRNVIGDRCRVDNYCYLDYGSVVGDDCVVSHCAELSGVLFRRVYLYHYMELYGLIGENTDIGAATVCGSLRFDDGETVQVTKGRREAPRNFSCATYIGDYCRTGVNVVIGPGRKIGPYSIIGAGTILNQDVPDHTLLYPKQELVQKAWSEDKYGW